MAPVVEIYEDIDVARLNNNTGAALATGDFVVLGGLCGKVTEAIANGAVGSVRVQDTIIQIEDFVSGEDTFLTVNADVFWDPTTGDFSDTETAGYYLIGQVVAIKNGNGIVEVYKYRNATLVEGT